VQNFNTINLVLKDLVHSRQGTFCQLLASLAMHARD